MHSAAGRVIGVAWLLLVACSSKSSSTPPHIGDAGVITAPSACVDGASLTLFAPVFELQGCRHAADAGVDFAVFSWANRTGQVQSVPYGPLNRVLPGLLAQGQGESFAIDARGTFRVPMTDSVTWTILGRSLTVSADSADCGETCSELLGGPDFAEIDSCTSACGDGTCDEGESCRDCPADCDCSALEPLLDCVSPAADGKRYASFGYRNAGLQGAGIAIGPDNQLTPGDQARKQPVFFPPGEQHHVFTVTYASAELGWLLGTSSVTATDDAPACAQSCTDCAPGIACVGDTCRASCGDGRCGGGEDCDSCPTDCTCGPNVCYHGGCATVATCGGFEVNCGAVDSFGVHLDCGACPDGLVCASNWCSPVCPSDGGAQP